MNRQIHTYIDAFIYIYLINPRRQEGITVEKVYLEKKLQNARLISIMSLTKLNLNVLTFKRQSLPKIILKTTFKHLVWCL